MSIIFFPKEILFQILMEITDYKTILKFYSCAKTMLQLAKKNQFWKHKLIRDFPLVKSQQVNQKYHKDYKWHSNLNQNIDLFAKRMLECKYEVQDDFQAVLNSAIVEVGRGIQISTNEFVCKIKDSDFEIPDDMIEQIKQAIQKCFGEDVEEKQTRQKKKMHKKIKLIEDDMTSTRAEIERLENRWTSLQKQLEEATKALENK